MPIHGICKLCQQSAHLLDSHLIPTSLYKHIRRSADADDKIVMMSCKVAKFTDEQIKDYLLCANCEGLFGRVEKWTVSNCLQADGSFPFRDAVVALPRHTESGDVALGEYLPDGEIGKLAYFAASVLSRAAVHRWKRFGSTVRLDLGSYTAEFRQYLLGNGDFPRETSFWSVRRGKGEYTRSVRYDSGAPLRTALSSVQPRCSGH